MAFRMYFVQLRIARRTRARARATCKTLPPCPFSTSRGDPVPSFRPRRSNNSHKSRRRAPNLPGSCPVCNQNMWLIYRARRCGTPRMLRVSPRGCGIALAIRPRGGGKDEGDSMKKGDGEAQNHLDGQGPGAVGRGPSYCQASAGGRGLVAEDCRRQQQYVTFAMLFVQLRIARCLDTTMLSESQMTVPEQRPYFILTLVLLYDRYVSFLITALVVNMSP
jgi:hypothetical protein